MPDCIIRLVSLIGLKFSRLSPYVLNNAAFSWAMPVSPPFVT